MNHPQVQSSPTAGGPPEGETEDQFIKRIARITDNLWECRQAVREYPFREGARYQFDRDERRVLIDLIDHELRMVLSLATAKCSPCGAANGALTDDPLRSELSAYAGGPCGAANGAPTDDPHGAT